MTPKSILPWKYKGATTAEGRICIRNLCTAHIYLSKSVYLQQQFKPSVQFSCIRGVEQRYRHLAYRMM